MLKRIRRGNVEVKANEIHDAIQEEANVEQVGFTGLFTERNLRKRVIIACGLVMALLDQHSPSVDLMTPF